MGHTNKDSVMLAWKRPKAADDIGYIVELRGPKDENYHILDTLDPDNTNYTVYGLQEGTDYEFRVQVVNIQMEKAVAEVVEAVQEVGALLSCLQHVLETILLSVLVAIVDFLFLF